MTRLLVSVRNASEAAAALCGGADLIDVKEPRRGSLGAPEPVALRRVVRQVASRRTVSVALGELGKSADLNELIGIEGVALAKVGLAAASRDWFSLWRSVVARFPTSLRPVGVIYADWRAARAPCPTEVVAAASQLRCAAVLVDTWDKTHGDVLAHVTREELSALFAAIRRCGMLAVAAGSLDINSVDDVLSASPDVVAVRGGVCRFGRTSEIDVQKVREMAARLSGCACR